MALTRADIATATRQYLDEVNAGVTVTGTIMTNAINRSQRRLNRETEYNRVDVQIALATGTREYTLTGTTTKIYRARLGGTRIRLDPTSVARLDNEEPGWENGTAGTPSRYYTNGKYFGVHPKPHSVAAAGTVYLNVLQTPANLSAAGSSPSWCPDEYHDTIAKLTAVDLAGGFLATTDAAPNRAGWLYDEYQREVQEMKRLATRRSAEYTGGFRPTGYANFRR
jgi:hypothetical protein